MSLSGGIKTATPDGGLVRGTWRNATAAIAAVVRAPRVKVSWQWRTSLVVGSVAAIAIVVAIAAVDRPVAFAVRHSPEWLIETFDVLTDFGKSGWFLWPTGLLLAGIAVLAPRALGHVSRMVLAMVAVRLGFLFAAIAVPGLVVSLLKRLIGRARPFVGSEPDPFLFVPLIWRADYASMPSGHVTTAFAAATAVSLIWPRMRVAMALYAVLIAATRVVLDAHFVSDTLAGAVFGISGALLVRDWFAARRLGFAVGADGQVRALPGPSRTRIKRVARSLAAP